MSLLDDARRLAQSDGLVQVDYRDDHAYYCPHCEPPNFRDGRHAPDCPVLVLPRIVALVEAAERIAEPCRLEDFRCQECEGGRHGHDADCPLVALVAALRGEETEA